jgi:hypothetical protein
MTKPQRRNPESKSLAHKRPEWRPPLIHQSITYASFTFAEPEHDLTALSDYLEPLEIDRMPERGLFTIPSLLSFAIHAQICRIDHNFCKNKSKKGR